MNVVGNAIPRIDGPLKTTGTANYTSDHHFPAMLYAVPVKSTIGKGRISSLDIKAAEKMPGVHRVFTQSNISPIFKTAPDNDFTAYLDEKRPPLHDDVINYYGQHVALVVADTFEQAKAAARAVKVTYQAQTPNVKHDLELGAPNKKSDTTSERGDAAKAFAAAPVKIDQTYTTPVETHSPIELHATVAHWEGDNLTLYETSQAVVNHRNVVSQQLGVGREKVRVVSKFLGSGFGGKLFPWPHSALTAAAARDLNRPVKLVLDRPACFQTAGHRPATQQRIRLSASANGQLTSIQHDYVNHTSILDDYEENCGEATANIYSSPNLRVAKGLTRRNVGTPTSMRGPGAVPGLFALETAMDELAIALKMDPVQLRILNEPKMDEGLKLPFSSRHLLECYDLGQKEFGWKNRTPSVGSMKRGDLTLGWGVAACTWFAGRFPAECIVDIRDDGTVRIASGTQDIGTGTYTMMAQITGQRLGVPADKIEVVLGDTTLPPGPINGGSMATASLVPAVFQAADAAIQKLFGAAGTLKGSAFEGKKPNELGYTDGRVHLKEESPSSGMSFSEILKSTRIKVASGSGKAQGTFGAKPTISQHSYGVHFVEVTWEAAIARLRVNRVVSVIDAGKIVNPKTARNQIEGAVVMGIGMGLFEETLYDHRSGAPVNGTFADYVMPVNADCPRVDVHFLDYPDKSLNEIGARGVGEIGLAGTAAAISNAVYHATGVRIRDLPITIDKLLAQGA